VGFFYNTCTVVVKVLLFTLSDFKVTGERNPPPGGLIVVSNHLSLIDPPILSACLDRRITFMAKRELFDHFLLGRLCRWWGAFPVRRGEPDREAYMHALKALEEGGLLGLFPEGTRSKGEGLMHAHMGTAMIAVRSGAPLLPVAITGSERVARFSDIFRRPRIRVHVGQPFALPEAPKPLIRESLEQLSDYIMMRIAELLPPAYQGAYAGRAGDYAPTA
jgi:1-acyl-sn-glycerol-3-phosphate acyltransferase